MLLAKINPAATFTSQDGPFAQPIVVTADYLTVLARPYVAGASKTNFEIQFGTYVPAVEGGHVKFNRVESSQLSLTAQELASWGTDDIALLDAVALKLGTTVVETTEVVGNNF